MIKVFLSYAHEDFSSAKRLYETLKAVPSVDVWFDKETLLPGQKWEVEIRKAIGNSRFFLLLISSHSTSKVGFYQKEISQALQVFESYPEGEIFLIPIRLNDCKPHIEQLTSIHHVDLFPDWDSGIDKILQVLKTHRRPQARGGNVERVTVPQEKTLAQKSREIPAPRVGPGAGKQAGKKRAPKTQAPLAKAMKLGITRSPRTFLSFIGLMWGALRKT